VSIIGKNPLIKLDNGGGGIGALVDGVMTAVTSGTEIEGWGGIADGVVAAVASGAEFEWATGVADGSGTVPPLSILDNEST
tara:strand:- start:10 stop:252 length:243 start_codon:yes stop_codon:yes gene_type:complete